ncbi:MAG: hypothetical protein K0Q53_597 [Massilibacillus sp.]|jgi:hypothetical protein|nr:hypothetical protein [Massilibacillus sp.]
MVHLIKAPLIPVRITGMRSGIELVAAVVQHRMISGRLQAG